MNKNRISTQPYKGARDFYPGDMAIREFIFSVWRNVCKSYGYEEYDGPLIEDFEIYAAKTGEEIVNNQLYSFEDRGGRKVAIRPEMTPTVARMVAQKYKTLHFPIRWFSIPNLWRYEKPQKGRLREHFQLNVDMFGEEDVMADFEILSIAVDIMKKLGATDKMFEIRVNNRRLMEDVFTHWGLDEKQRVRVSKAIDRKNKITSNEFESLLAVDAKLDGKTIIKVCSFLELPESTINTIYDKSTGAKEIKELLELCRYKGISNIVKYDPGIMRGFDYYTGNIFEQYDLNPDNNRSMYGGGRYDNLVETFINTKIPGVGLGMGDVTMKIFLENWGLLPDINNKAKYFNTRWPEDNDKILEKTIELSTKIRAKGRNVVTWTKGNTPISKQLKYADRHGYKWALIQGNDELTDETVTVKDLESGDQEKLTIEELLAKM